MNRRQDLSAELTLLQQRSGTKRAREFWRSLEELSETAEFQELMRQEFPEQADIWPNDVSRRRFLTLMSASLALAGLNGCSVRPAPSEDLVPYVRPPEEGVPGRPLFYATAMTHGGSAIGLLVESHAGRPTKVEGNPGHPASVGATDIFSQASVLTLYDPDRSQSVTHLGRPRTWGEASGALNEAAQKFRHQRGAGFYLITGDIVSPTLNRQLSELFEAWPEAKWHIHEPINRNTAVRGAMMAFGEPLDAVYDFSQADIVVALDADFLNSGSGWIAYAQQFMNRRRVRTTASGADKADMSRLYVAETVLSCTGAKADHRLALSSANLQRCAHSIAVQLGVMGGADDRIAIELGTLTPWIGAVVQDLNAHRGKSLIIAGDRQPPAVHLLAHAINDHLGNVGKTVRYIEPITARPALRQESLADFVRDAQQGKVELLLVCGSNPVLTAPVDLEFAKHLQRVPLRLHFGLYQDETAHHCHWHLPEAHYLESWSDTRAFDGTASVVQPLIEPLYEGRSVHEVVALLADGLASPARDLVRQTWRAHLETVKEPTESEVVSDAAFETFWRTALHDGLLAGTASTAKDAKLAETWQRHLQPADGDESVSAPRHGEHPLGDSNLHDLELIFVPDPTIYDGRYANNGWLQELPKPLTKLAWGNAAIMNPKTAARLGLEMGSYAHGGEHGGYHQPVVELQLEGRSVRAPLWIMPGHVDGTVSLYLGYGRSHAGRVGGGDNEVLGSNAYALRTSGAPWFAAGLKVVKTGSTQLVACTQQHQSLEGRDQVRGATLAKYRDDPLSVARPSEELVEKQQPQPYEPLTLYQDFDYQAPKHKWGMSIDLTTCIGCEACMVACQAENNIPIVGLEQVAAGREMHWLRVDRYIHGEADAPDGIYFQPVPCMHCENAPCEYVCPVAATVHSSEGLNEMIYNRCVGTRFCSNNCPYKVRRFNFLAFADFETPTTRMQYNPDVTVRSRGVMEKCSYCIQRIRQAEIGADVDGRRVVDGEVVTACQAACPTRAISFGDMNDSASEVKQWKDSPLHYALLADLNTKPRTTYLAALRNPHPDLKEGPA
jgi:molybdopterin-containing oxidoreductase family iron-sulfur binding subunit